MRSVTNRSRRRRRIGFFVALTVVVVLLTGSTGGAWYYSAELLQPDRVQAVDYPEKVISVRPEGPDASVVLTESARTAKPGTWGLEWATGSVRVGDVLRRGDGRVERRLVAGAPPEGASVRMTSDVWHGDPRSAHGLEFTDVAVRTELGDAPAWFVPAPATAPATADTPWVITVHGRGATRRESLRALPVVHRLGLPVLAITYRNDVGAPASPDGLFHLGDTEWRDVEAAMRYARDKGAQRVVLYGWSMGGAIVGQLLARSELASMVSKVVLDAPVLSWRRTLDLQAGNRGVPSAFTPVAELVSGWRADLDFDRFELAAHPPAAKPPTLLLHGSADRTVPVQTSRELAAAAPGLGWPVRYVEFPDAEHVAEWNADPARYESAVSEFLRG
ncbi:alpha/beta hydrolase family protein [Streptoalloteichus hindustanus]|uniref:Peptidase S9 prolyl oligopeptidase catalytic domain-containing protein n=1 Tax=Streptoalloteichus hindustanus TaxID=2017 RepID=A0A1M5KUZ2_STRHI|nr:alpha/beta fold hydrolase [Streptoalloteichus hindustanus]SHG56500.1 hypothetical protein SAMN05444320_11060 [Streptoalloteichus hindustanus]